MKNKINSLVKIFGYKLIKNIPRRDYHIVLTDKGFFLLKKINCKISEILFIHGAKEHLISNGFTNIDRYITVKEKPYIEYDGDYYIMTNLVRGRKYDPKNLKGLEKASKTLARFHNASKGYEPKVKIKSRSNIGKLQEAYLEKCEDFIYMKSLIKMRAKKDEIDFLFLENADRLYDIAMDSVKMLQQNGYFRFCKEEEREKYFCHNEYNHNNIIIDRNEEYNIINFDSCKFELVCVDIATLIMEAMDSMNWDFESALQILESYNSVRKIKAREYELMNSFLQFPQDIWEITTRYYYEDYKYYRNKNYNKLKDKIEKLTYRLQFLEKYKRALI